MNEQKRKYAMLGGLLGAVYLAAGSLLPGIPELLLGAVLGVAIVFFVLALLPEKNVKKVRKWKRRG